MTTNFLWNPGTGNNGLIASAVTLMTTELESIASGSVIISSVNGSSGPFTNSNTAQAIWADLFYYPGNAGCTPTAGANMSGWWLTSLDGGTTFESTTVAPARQPDWVIPLPASAIGGANTIVYRTAGIIRVPALAFKILVQNNAGVTWGAGGTTAPYLKMAPYAVQY
jgi:hypothetical protein